MKIKFKLLISVVLSACMIPCAWAQVTVVKQDGQKVYLDISEYKSKISVGDSFKIIISQEILTNPKTGKELGKINQYCEGGKITEIQPLYAIGQIPSAKGVTLGQEVVFEKSSASASSSATQTPTAPIQKNTNRSIKTYPLLEREVISAVKTNLNTSPEEEVAVVDTKGNLVLYALQNDTLQQVAEYKLPAGKRFITLSAKDLLDQNYAQLFAVVYHERDQKISTMIFQAQGNTLTLIDTIPYFVKELGCNDDKEIYAQKAFIGGKKAGDARELDDEKGKFRLDDDRLSTRGHWLMGMNYYEIQNEEDDNFVYTSSNGKIRLRLHNGKYAESPALFAGAPNRVKYKQDIISFYPSLQVYGPDGHATLAAVENVTKLGILSEQFGQYNSSKIHFMTYENGILDVRETVELNGFLYDTNCTARGILAPQVLSSGQTVLTEIYR